MGKVHTISKLRGKTAALKDTWGIKDEILTDTLHEDTPEADNALRNWIIDSLEWLDTLEDL